MIMKDLIQAVWTAEEIDKKYRKQCCLVERDKTEVQSIISYTWYTFIVYTARRICPSGRYD